MNIYEIFQKANAMDVPNYIRFKREKDTAYFIIDPSEDDEIWEFTREDLLAEDWGMEVVKL